jgi:parvulin-like peptidyl-prolyl isomerase
MQVRASHILVATQEQAQDLRDQLTAGADFAQLAHEHSLCASGQQGGDIGTFGAGQMFIPLEMAAFATELDQVSDPVRSEHGWHLIKRTA